jgi:hypothetical protein
MIQIMYYTQSGFLYTVLFVFHISHRLENTEEAIKTGQSRETDNIGYYTRHKKNKTKTQHNMCWTPLYQANTNNVHKT